ncbi:STAS domain-containing protein [uncultured Agrobacterium sp.]|uniref:STAS domain-containing protein n=1 Tax=uncultured Agrobacterium sp. TaxID=157277 RepID=UPI0025FA7E6B|nr:STAS domain-containing protein [uncultured Agrobacterium sp.]
MAGRTAAHSTLKLSPVLDLTQASVLYGKLKELRGKPVTVDASEVERVGAQCVQILMAGIKAWEADGKQFTFSKASEAFDKTLKLIGVDIGHMLPKEI